MQCWHFVYCRAHYLPLRRLGGLALFEDSNLQDLFAPTVEVRAVGADSVGHRQLAAWLAVSDSQESVRVMVAVVAVAEADSGEDKEVAATCTRRQSIGQSRDMTVEVVVGGTLYWRVRYAQAAEADPTSALGSRVVAAVEEVVLGYL